MDKQIDQTRSRRNANLWKSLVGLKNDYDGQFPELKPLDDERLLDQMVIDEELKKEIVSSLTSNQLTLISIRRGGGLSTFFRYMTMESVQKSLDRLTITVDIDLASPDMSSTSSLSTIERVIKRRTISELLDQAWEDRLKKDYYYQCINYDEKVYDELSFYKADMLEKLARPPGDYTFENLCTDVPFVAKKFADFCNYLLFNFRMQIQVFYHCPETVSEENFLNIIGVLKSIHDNNTIELAALREAYFCTPQTRAELDREYRRPYHVIIVPPYSPGQIYTMLAGCYRPSIPGSRGRKPVDLSSIFSDKFIHNAWKDSLSLKEIINQVKRLMVKRFDCEQRDLTYLLEPQLPLKKDGENLAEMTKPFAGKRFSRKKNIPDNIGASHGN